MPRVIVVSDRLPVEVVGGADPRFVVEPTFQGPAVAFESLDNYEKTWIGALDVPLDDGDRQEISRLLAENSMIPVFLGNDEIDSFFNGGFARKTLWPHFHYFTQITKYTDAQYDLYRQINLRFAEAVFEIVTDDDDDYIWVHDYRLMLVPRMLRAKLKSVGIGYFLHVPFPSYEIFRTLPWRKDLLNGVLGADYVAFNTGAYMSNFLEAVQRICWINSINQRIPVDDRVVSVGYFPMSIDYDLFAGLRQSVRPAALDQDWSLERLSLSGMKTIVSIQNLDYTNGVSQQIKAFLSFLQICPNYIGRVSFLLVVRAVSFDRELDAELRAINEQIEILVSRVNSKICGLYWLPIHYTTKTFSIQETISLYRQADVCLCLPLRDGANHQAKEFISAKHDLDTGVLILSEFSGSADRLEEAILVNPHDQYSIAKSLKQALEMSSNEQKSRLEALRNTIFTHSPKTWTNMIMWALHESMENNKSNKSFQLTNNLLQKELIDHYRKARKRLLLLKYDGTLMALSPNPDEGKPDFLLTEALRKLCADRRNQVVILSGRDKGTLNEWLGAEHKLDFAGEDGVWTRIEDKWDCAVSNGDFADVEKWKEDVRNLLGRLCSSIPSTQIEDRAFALLWHYRGVDRDAVNMRLRNYESALKQLAKKYDLQCVRGNNMIEIRPSKIKKGHAASKWLNPTSSSSSSSSEFNGRFLGRGQWDFILAIGDDSTDEDTFEVVNAADRAAYTVKVGGFGGGEVTAARFALSDVVQVRELLDTLIRNSD